MSVSIHGIPDPPDDSAIDVSRLEDSIILWQFDEANQSTSRPKLTRFASIYFDLWRTSIKFMVAAGVIFAVAFAIVVIRDPAPVSTRLFLLFVLSLFMTCWFGMCFFFLKSSRNPARSTAKLADLDRLPDWRIEIREDRMIYSNLARGIAREFEPRSIRDIFVVDGCVAGSAFDLNKQRTVEFEIGPTLTPGDAEWLRQILA